MSEILTEPPAEEGDDTINDPDDVEPTTDDDLEDVEDHDDEDDE